MTAEWIDLTDMSAVTIAQNNGWEIEFRHTPKDRWQPWETDWWHKDSTFRGRPRQPKMKKVKLLAWMHTDDGTLRYKYEKYMMQTTKWIRVPAEDKEIEVPE